MMFPKETSIHDAELEIVVPNDILDYSEEKFDDIIGIKQRTQIFYDEFLHFYLITTLPHESNLEDKESATEFFKNLEVTLEATLININLAVTSDYSSQLVRRASSSSSTMSSISGIFNSGCASIRSRSNSTSTSSTSPTVPGSPASDYSFKKYPVNKFTEGSVIYNAQYNSKNKNYNNMVVVKRDGRWICVLPLSFPIAYVRTRAPGQITLNITVTQPHRKMMKSLDSNLYSIENFGMNLLGGLDEDPAFESLNTLCSVPSSRFTKQDSTKRVTALASAHKILSVKQTLNVRIKITNISSSENSLMMSVEIENDTEHDITFSIEDVKIEIAHAFVTRYGWSQGTSNDKFPILLQPVDQVTLLYNITILEDSSFPRALNTQQHCPTPMPNSEASSRRGSIASINPILNVLPVENKHRTLSLIVKACPIIDGVKSRCYIESRRNCMLDVSTLLSNSTTAANNLFNLNNMKSYNSLNNIAGIGLGINTTKNDTDAGNNGILPRGRLPKLQKPIDFDVCDGVTVSFVVCGEPVVGRIFTIKVFMVNNSKQVRRFTIMIPSKKGLDERLLQSQLSPNTLFSQTTDITLVESNNVENVKPLRSPFMDETEILRKHMEIEVTNASLICLDDNVKVCSIDPYKSESATLHFVSIKEALQAVELVQLIDNDTGFVTNLRNVVQVDVKRNTKNQQRRIDHNPIVFRHIEVTG